MYNHFLGAAGGSGTFRSMNFIPVKFGIVTLLLATLLAACAPAASGVPAAPVVVTRIVEVSAEVVTEVVVTATQAAITHTPSPTVSSSALIGEKIEITGKACQWDVDITKIVGKYLVSCIDGRWSNGVVKDEFDAFLKLREGIQGMNLPKAFLDNAYLLAEAGRNVPKKNPEFHIFFGDTIPKQLQNDIKKLMDILIDVFGGYDRWVHALYDYDVKATNKTLVSGLEKLGYFKYNFDSGVTPSFARVVERASCLVRFSAGPRGPIDDYSFCNDPYTFTNPNQAFGLQFYGEKGMRYRAATNSMIHEYHHHVQNAHDLGKEGSRGNGPGAPFPPDGFAPYWWIEGTAGITPPWIMRDYFNEFEITK